MLHLSVPFFSILDELLCVTSDSFSDSHYFGGAGPYFYQSFERFVHAFFELSRFGRNFVFSCYSVFWFFLLKSMSVSMTYSSQASMYELVSYLSISMFSVKFCSLALSLFVNAVYLLCFAYLILFHS